jgi:DNA-binding HxlR family transcriptional regulator
MRKSDLKKIVTGCALEQFFVFFGKRWALHIVWSLGENGELAFGEMARVLPGRVSAKIMTARLRALENQGLIVRQPAERRGKPVRYALSEKGMRVHRLLVTVEKNVDRIDDEA